ncbi:competence protein ComK [Salipaludibacillus daqingensis]|uniref:competence protein ComK n=1 Tax=Salipaludibacillus daqingensis TaxID=3041001 RepID=UPI0024756963|nr:competence protein ComK [Salipaludibacillus daqingensis]
MCIRMNEQIFTILSTYTINKKESHFSLKQTTMQLIELAYIKGGASYDGRRIAAIHQLGVYKRIPVAINTDENIYAFPTCSTLSLDFLCEHIKD